MWAASSSRLRKLFLLSGALPLFGLLAKPPSIQLLIYPVFVFAAVRPDGWWRRFAVKRKLLTAFFFSAFLVGLLAETLAWLQNYAEGFKNPGQLLSTNYFEDLLIASGFYLGIALGFSLVLRRYNFSVRQVFVTFGLFGVLLEQNGAVFLNALGIFFANPLLSLLFVVFVFLVHGSIAALAFMPVAERYLSPDKKEGWLKYPLAWAALFVCVKVGTMLTGGISKIFYG